jgi:phosphatidate phosphatase APP1
MININPAPKRGSQTELLCYPAWGYQLESGNWRLNLSGVAWLSPVVFTRRQKMMIRMLGNVMKASPEEMACEVFNDRITPFMAEADKRRKITATIAGQEFSLRKKTRGNGHFRNWLIVPSELVKRAQSRSDSGSNILPIELSVEGEEATDQVGARLLPRHGVSVVSDIDDTVKDSEVSDRRELLNNTFIRDFRLVDGMAETYRTWAKSGAEFHYVSSSPWQLFESLLGLQEDFDLPSGTMHLRNFRLRDQLFKKLIIRRQGKRLAIQKLLKCFPDRKFVLVGDSGEKDPEIYLKICKRNPGRIKGLFIRDLKQKPMDEELFDAIQEAMSGNLCARFSTGNDLLDLASAVFA